MGLRVTLEFHQIEDVVFDDINDLNDDLLNNTEFRGLYEEQNKGDKAYQNNDLYDGPFRQLSPDKVQIACVSEGSYFEQYDTVTDVWGCWSIDEARVIANHMIEGKIVFLQEIEGNDNVYWIITPHNVVEKSAAKLKF